MQSESENIKEFIPGNEVTFMRKGDSFFQHMKNIILNAEKEIHLQTYIWMEDEIGTQINNAILLAASRGVKVFIVLDAYGSSHIRKNEEWLRTWRKAGIYFRFFGQLFTGKNLNIGRRMHHKILIADGRETLVTGRNIADRYNDNPGSPGWLDFAVRVKGPVGVHLRQVAISFWPKYVRHPIESNPDWLDLSPAGNTAVKIAQNDFFRGIYEMHDSYRMAFTSAKKDITVVGAYFLPGRKIRNAIASAIKNGARVRVIFSDHTDVPLANYATQYLYAWLLRNNVEIYEWRTTVVHGKVAVVDNLWSTVGSYNLNYLSALESIELNYIFLDRDVAGDIENELNKIINKECRQITREEFSRSHTIVKKLREWFSYRLYRYALRVLLLFGGKKKKLPKKQKALEG